MCQWKNDSDSCKTCWPQNLHAFLMRPPLACTCRSLHRHHSADNHQLIIAWTCVLSLWHTHTCTHAHTHRHTWIAWGAPSILISTPLQSADGKLSVCQSHKLTHPSCHYLIIMISHQCLIVMTSRHQTTVLPFLITLHLASSCQDPWKAKDTIQTVRLGPVWRVITIFTLRWKRLVQLLSR